MNSLLVVDDEPLTRSLVVRLARSAGYTVGEAACAGDALDRMASCPSAVVLCDVAMPDRSGLWLVTQLHRQFPDSALVMMTGLGHQEMEAGLDNGAMACLSKPFTRAQLLEVLQSARDWRSSRRPGRMLASAASPREVHPRVAAAQGPVR
jgi:CheY-like chemotaxis protein